MDDTSTKKPGSKERVVRLARPSVIVLCGPAAGGKSTFAARHFRPTQVISSDQCRAWVSDDENDQRYTEQAFSLLHTIIEKRLSINRLSVVDSTALNQMARRNLISLAGRYGVPCVLFLFPTPLETCLARDAARERQVGAEVIERQFRNFQEAMKTVRKEGFDHVVEFPQEGLDQVRIEVVFRPPKRQVKMKPKAKSQSKVPGGAPRPPKPPEAKFPKPDSSPVSGAGPLPTGEAPPAQESTGKEERKIKDAEQAVDVETARQPNQASAKPDQASAKEDTSSDSENPA